MWHQFMHSKWCFAVSCFWDSTRWYFPISPTYPWTILWVTNLGRSGSIDVSRNLHRLLNRKPQRMQDWFRFSMNMDALHGPAPVDSYTPLSSVNAQFRTMIFTLPWISVRFFPLTYKNIITLLYLPTVFTVAGIFVVAVLAITSSIVSSVLICA